MAAPAKLPPKPKARPADAFPFKAVAEELTYLQKVFHELVQNYAAVVEGEIATLKATIMEQSGASKKLPVSRAHDLRDMLMLVRSLEVKPTKGRRRDMKKIEVLLEELRKIVDRWG